MWLVTELHDTVNCSEANESLGHQFCSIVTVAPVYALRCLNYRSINQLDCSRDVIPAPFNRQFLRLSSPHHSMAAGAREFIPELPEAICLTSTKSTRERLAIIPSEVQVAPTTRQRFIPIKPYFRHGSQTAQHTDISRAERPFVENHSLALCIINLLMKPNHTTEDTSSIFSCCLLSGTTFLNTIAYHDQPVQAESEPPISFIQLDTFITQSQENHRPPTPSPFLRNL
ncbi:uncharacterized protein MYCFIDRAFT_176261 [Pseudocercospora fijiensis CIRAD86]|uniref:Uncharacterized protein n=1 Tax=Pseudocercospora fijiensis (strain CIRAD86) TaxID=383855 RepID=M2ZP65_PSEFD|nr:uncharacterized protein MYCFIDRAFT_176261 [Pseudocercospora fijiensis CIRAD86]EME80904.1 hypothetical protein MYCFIDRAFT_176261 [Pseudocercospora fijiensis CIRAD86]